MPKQETAKGKTASKSPPEQPPAEPIPNLELWDRVEKTDPAWTKQVEFGKRKFTAVAPYNQIKMATELFGPMGKGFGLVNVEWELFCPTDNLQFMNFSAMFFYVWQGERIEFPIFSSIKILDSDYRKKVYTDTLTKALSYLGFNSDVFMGKFDDVKYVEQRKAEEKIKKEQANGNGQGSGHRSAGDGPPANPNIGPDGMLKKGGYSAKNWLAQVEIMHLDDIMEKIQNGEITITGGDAMDVVTLRNEHLPAGGVLQDNARADLISYLKWLVDTSRRSSQIPG